MVTLPHSPEQMSLTLGHPHLEKAFRLPLPFLGTLFENIPGTARKHRV